MIENVRLKPYKGLQGCDLNRLGRITVVCGKNNSGKSTLLEAINKGDASGLGRLLDEADYETLFQQAATQMGWDGSPGLPLLWRKVIGKFRLQHPDRVWFVDEAEEFAAALQSAYNQGGGARFPLNPRALATAFKARVERSSPTALIPAKRSLQFTCVYDMNEQLAPDGAGAINYLFRLKNANPGTPVRICFDKIHSAFQQISGGYSFNISSKQGDAVLTLHYRTSEGEWYTADSCGLGLSDLLVILVAALDARYATLLIEEPESHLHPEFQRRLLIYLTQQTDKQYILSTHSNVFVTSSLVDRVLVTTFDSEPQIREGTSKARALHDLGYSVADNLVADVVVLVEGPSDVPVLEAFLMKMGLLNNYNVRMWPLGGDIMHKLDLSVLGGMKVVALVDADPGSRRIRERFIENCSRLGIPVHKLARYSIENYFTLEALRAVYPNRIDDAVVEIHPKRPLQEQLSFSVKGCNGKIASAMELSDIEGTDLYDFLETVRSVAHEGGDLATHLPPVGADPN